MYSCSTSNTNNSGRNDSFLYLATSTELTVKTRNNKQDNSRKRWHLCVTQTHFLAPFLYRNFSLYILKKNHTAKLVSSINGKNKVPDVYVIQNLCCAHLIRNLPNYSRDTSVLISLCGKKWTPPFCELLVAEALLSSNPGWASPQARGFCFRPCWRATDLQKHLTRSPAPDSDQSLFWVSIFWPSLCRGCGRRQSDVI